MSGIIQKVHFIGICEDAMHSLALSTAQQGAKVTGSDDEISRSAYSVLNSEILPEKSGWFPNKISDDLNSIVLGRHIKKDNPEFLKAKDLGLQIYSYPQYIYKQSIDKHRIVIAGSHGKTSITAMILHVLKFAKREFDYVIGEQLDGFDSTIKITDAPLIVIEGDESFNSAIDVHPDFLHYKHHIGLVSGVAWDYMNMFPTFEDYVKQFDAFADATPKGGMLIYSQADDLATLICGKEREDVQAFEYSAHKNEIINGQTYLLTSDQKIPIKVFGKHNMKNISGAKTVCSKICINDKTFYEAIQSFHGVSNRLELLEKNSFTAVFKDFAYAPSKLKATTNAVKKQFGDRKLTAILELHTFSSLNKNFLSQYQDTFKAADEPIIYYNPKNIRHKELGQISTDEIITAFNNSKLKVYKDNTELKNYLLSTNWEGKNLLFMSAGNFDGLILEEIAKEIVEKIKQPNS